MNVAIILAAGESQRMGQPKQLLPFGGKTMLECVIDAFQTPRVDEIRVVLGYKADEIAAKIENSRRKADERRAEPARPTNDPVGRGGLTAPLVKIVRNARYQQGMFTSIQAGLRALPKKTKLVMIAVCDQPRLQRSTVETLIEHFEKEQHKILIPSYQGRQGHPPVLRAEYAKEILAMDESLTLKHFYAEHADDIARLVVEDEGALVDIDDPITYRKQLEAVVGRVAPRGAGKHTKLPRRLRRLNTIWAGDGYPCFFVTICVQGRVQVLANDTVHGRLREFLMNSPHRRGWWPSRYVIMPDHLHLLLRRGESPRGPFSTIRKFPLAWRAAACRSRTTVCSRRSIISSSNPPATRSTAARRSRFPCPSATCIAPSAPC